MANRSGTRRMNSGGMVAMVLLLLATSPLATQTRGQQHLNLSSLKHGVLLVATPDAPNEDLTGAWTADDGATYYLHQDGNEIWWFGISQDGGRSFANVFRGTRQPTSPRITGNWADMPIGASRQQGQLALSIVHIAAPPGGTPSIELRKMSENGGFGASRWQRGAVTPPSDPPDPTPASPVNRNDITGTWTCDDGGTYYMRRIGRVVWWIGMSGDGGRSFTNVFQGSWQPNTASEEPADFGTVAGDWSDVPKGSSGQSGTLRLSFRFSQELWKRGQTGPFGGSRWRRVN
jgi:hypothetical protein